MNNRNIETLCVTYNLPKDFVVRMLHLLGIYAEAAQTKSEYWYCFGTSSHAFIHDAPSYEWWGIQDLRWGYDLLWKARKKEASKIMDVLTAASIEGPLPGDWTWRDIPGLDTDSWYPEKRNGETL